MVVTGVVAVVLVVYFVYLTGFLVVVVVFL